MAINVTYPGVYVDEIPTLPASVAGVNTAIPAFIGYVEKAELNGQPVVLNTPVRITSLLEYETIFGKAQSTTFTVNIVDDLRVNPVQRTISVGPPGNSSYRMYYNLQMYFANGGGPCYIVPVGFYFSSTNPVVTDFLKGLEAIAKIDEATLLLMPDALSLTPVANLKLLYDTALAQCEDLKDRFVIMDVPYTGANNFATDKNNFRDNAVGPDNLKYGAAYYPYLNTVLNYGIDLNLVNIASHKQMTIAVPTPTDIPNSAQVITFMNEVNKTVVVAKQALAAAKLAAVTLTQADATFAASITGLANTAATAADAAPVGAGWFSTAKAKALLAKTQAGDAVNEATPFAAPGGQTASNAADLITELQDLIVAATVTLSEGNLALQNPSTVFIAGSLAFLQIDNPAVFTSILSQINTNLVTLNPSGAMAGIYARVDSDRGVWKAPANVGVRSVIGPAMNMTNAEQGELNIDATSGKSINGLRAFTGKGTLVWGGRTLAGNDNEWRYINVRRLFNYMEESIAEATAFVVFEPNDANTWKRTSGMIESFLNGLWRDGALAGAVPKDAYFVRVGLGSTMTAQDILEGRMIIEVGVAAVRPAEFIILKFMHKIQES